MSLTIDLHDIIGSMLSIPNSLRMKRKEEHMHTFLVIVVLQENGFELSRLSKCVHIKRKQEFEYM